MMIEEFDIVVIGGGPAGMAAALAAESYAQNLRIAIIERAPELGGILNQCTHTGFGLTYFGEELTGQEYAKRFVQRAAQSRVEVFNDTTVLSIGNDRDLTITGRKTGLVQMRAKAVVLATGCRERPIGALPVEGTRPSGVYSAGMAQKMMNLSGYDLGNRFVILGSGDVGLIVARHLALAGKEVIAVVEKEADCGGLPRNRINCLEKHGIPLLTNTTVSRVHGVGRITGVTMKRSEDIRASRTASGTVSEASSEQRANADIYMINYELPELASERFIECDTLITSVGLIPERELLEGMICSVGGSGASGEYNAAYKHGSDPVKGLPEWLFLCGNACYVHDAADDVTIESQRVGEFAAQYVISGETQALKPLGRVTSADIADKAAPNNTAASMHNYVETVLCTACPKGCKAFLTINGWQGLACGRAEPANE